MEIVDPRSTLLTNQEVYELLIEAKERQKSTSKGSQNHNTIIYETLKYFNEYPTNSHQPKETIIQLAKALKKYKLTGAEIMQIANLRPKQALEIQLIVEESEERFSEEEIDEMVDLICKIYK